jgi:phosphate transport system substrate-binding protein
MTSAARTPRLHRLVVALAFLGLLAGSGVAATEGENATAAPGQGQDEEPTILLTIAGDDGSATSIIPQIATDYLAFRGAGSITRSKADPPWNIEISGTMLNGERVAVLIRASSSTDGLSELADGTAMIGLSLRDADPNELPGFASLTPAQEARAVRPIALNAMVLIVNRETGVLNLTLDDCRGIYSGTIKDWAAVGGKPGPIRYYGRATDYKNTGLCGAASGKGSMRVVSSYAAMRDSVVGDTQAIGYVPVNFIYQERMNWTGKIVPIRFRLGDRLTAMPNQYGLATGDYPLVFHHLLYRLPGSDGDNEEVDTFFQQADSVSTRVIDMFAGLTSVTPRLLVPMFDQPLPPEYQAIVRNALRVSTTVRFDPGPAKITPSTKRSLDDLATFLRGLDQSPERLRHLVFSEDTGNPERNQDIAEQLAAVFQRELRARNVRLGEVTALGAALPLAGSDNPLGQWLNRRVETWITP